MWGKNHSYTFGMREQTSIAALFYTAHVFIHKERMLYGADAFKLYRFASENSLLQPIL